MSDKKLQELYERALAASKGKTVEPRVRPKAKRWNSISIGALEKGVRTLATKLENLGLKTQIDVFKTGPGGVEHYGPSYVELEVTGVAPDQYGAPGEMTDVWATVKFIAGGYGEPVGSRGEIGGGEGWSNMSAYAQEYIMKELVSDGWAPPGRR